MASAIVGEMRPGSAKLSQDGLSFESTFDFLVFSTDKFASRESIITETPGLPVVGLEYGPAVATCVSIDANRRDKHPQYWDVRCTFQTAEETQRINPNAPSLDPTTWFPVWRIKSFATKQRAIWVDKTPADEANQWGDMGPAAIRNSAEQPFETPATELRTLVKFRFTQYEPQSGSYFQMLKTVSARNESVNDAEFAEFDARTLLLNVVDANAGYFNGFYAWKVEYEVTYDPDTHDLELIDVGSTYLDSGTLKPYMDETNTYRIVGRLDGAGAKKTDEGYEVLTFRVKTESVFSEFLRV